MYIAAGKKLEIRQVADMNARVRLDETLTGEGSVNDTVEASGGYGGTSTNATLSGDLTLAGGKEYDIHTKRPNSQLENPGFRLADGQSGLKSALSANRAHPV